MPAVNGADAAAEKPKGGATKETSFADPKETLVLVHVQTQVMVRRAVTDVDAVKSAGKLLKGHPERRGGGR
jgi:hypothetical protein